jgi:hypothetical protein
MSNARLLRALADRRNRATIGETPTLGHPCRPVSYAWRK